MNKRFRYYTYIEPLTKSKTVKTYGVHILTLFVMTLFIIFAIKPTVETILVLQKRLTDYQSTLDQINQKSENLRQGRRNYQELDPTIKSRIQVSIPSNPDLKTLTSELEAAARANQASISALQLQPLKITETPNGQTLKTLTEVFFTFNIEGSYQNLLNTLNSIQDGARLISIDNLILNKSTEGASLLMSVNGKAYYLK